MCLRNDFCLASTKKERASWLSSIAVTAIYILFSWKKILGVSALLIFFSYFAGMILPIAMKTERHGVGHIGRVAYLQTEIDDEWGLTSRQCAVKVSDNSKIFYLNWDNHYSSHLYDSPTLTIVTLLTEEWQTKERTKYGHSQLVVRYLVQRENEKNDLKFRLPYYDGFPNKAYYTWRLGEFGHFRCNEGYNWYRNAAMLLSKSKPVYEKFNKEEVMDSSCVYHKKGKKTVLNTDNNWKDSKWSNFATVDIAMFKWQTQLLLTRTKNYWYSSMKEENVYHLMKATKIFENYHYWDLSDGKYLACNVKPDGR